MPNISAETLGTGYYPEDVFEQQIYDQGIDQDWWIEDSNYRNLLQDLQKINFEIKESWYYVVDSISYYDKDLPANPGLRFPGAAGVLGTTSYSPLRYVRVPQSLKAQFVALNSIAYHVVFSFRGGNDPGSSSGEALRDAALKYGQILGTVATTVVETYSRARFEREFNLNWIVNTGGDDHLGSSQGSGRTHYQWL